MNLISRSLLPLLVSALCAASCCAQAAPQNPPPLPKNPAALMQLAWQQNGLHGPGMAPWHLLAQWKAADRHGNVTAHGTWEIWWVNSDESKSVIAAPGFRQTTYETDDGLFVEGDSGSPKAPVWLADEMLLAPVPQWSRSLSVGLRMVDHRDRGQKLKCAVLVSKSIGVTTGMSLGQYCFSSGVAAIRAVARWDTETIFNSFVLFQGRYVARDIRVVSRNIPAFDIHVQTLEPISSVTESDFVPPPDAVSTPAKRVQVARGVMAAQRIGGNPPTYPLFAKENHVEGIVSLDLTIGTDGAVKDIRDPNGPMPLRDAAIASVRTWRYLPYLLDGEPVEVNTTVDVIFSLSNH